jgi:hypothetical protein
MPPTAQDLCPALPIIRLLPGLPSRAERGGTTAANEGLRQMPVPLPARPSRCRPAHGPGMIGWWLAPGKQGRASALVLRVALKFALAGESHCLRPHLFAAAAPGQDAG